MSSVAWFLFVANKHTHESNVQCWDFDGMPTTEPKHSTRSFISLKIFQYQQSKNTHIHENVNAFLLKMISLLILTKQQIGLEMAAI